MNNQNKLQTGVKAEVKTISKSIDSALSPLAIFKHYSEQSKTKANNNLILLESSEINSKKEVKSIMMLQAALRIECNDQQVIVQPITHNGENALTHIKEQLIDLNLSFEEDSRNSNDIIIFYPTINVSADEDSRLKQTSSFDFLRLITQSFIPINAPEYGVFIAGIFAYDMIASFENLPKVETANNTCPDYVFYLSETLLVMDHKNNQSRLYTNQFTDKNKEKVYFELSRSFSNYAKSIANLSKDLSDESIKIETDIKTNLEYQVNLSDKDYQQTVEQLKNNIVQGDVFQVVPSRTFSMICDSPIESYQILKELNPSPYLFFMQDKDFCLFGASPESSLKYTKKTNHVELYPIAGTRPRGKDSENNIIPDLDSRIEIELKLDQKEVAEHMMLVDLARNDIARVSQPGSTDIPKLLEVDRYSQVMHLVSCVRGQLREDLDALHAYQACMNMGTLTGAPKIKATELIRQVEQTRRGSYGGAIGYLNAQGDMDTCIIIRSAFCKEGMAYIQAGAGIVYDSIPQLESEETINKAKAVINAIAMANTAPVVSKEVK